MTCFKIVEKILSLFGKTTSSQIGLVIFLQKGNNSEKKMEIVDVVLRKCLQQQRQTMEIVDDFAWKSSKKPRLAHVFCIFVFSIFLHFSFLTCFISLFFIVSFFHFFSLFHFFIFFIVSFFQFFHFFHFFIFHFSSFFHSFIF